MVSCCFVPCLSSIALRDNFVFWRFCSGNRDDEILLSSFREACDKMGDSIYEALRNQKHDTGLSDRLKEALLLGCDDGDGDWEDLGEWEANTVVKGSPPPLDICYGGDDHGASESEIDSGINETSPLSPDQTSTQPAAVLSNKPPMFKGLPHRPLYRELARRIVLLTRWCHFHNHQAIHRPILPAAVLGLTESTPPNLLLPTTHRFISASTCSTWLCSLRPSSFSTINATINSNSSDAAVLELLGMRLTTGTLPSRPIPPPIHVLLQAANAPHRPQAKSPSLTVAARARAKHAHRSNTLPSFFGTVNGGTASQNTESAAIVESMLRNAVWCNVHMFGGMGGGGVLEVRVVSGYGARWSGDWEEEGGGNDVLFRGFLEPQMENGFEKRWRH